MAALALIFAIQDFEPSPFYYFDEVDQNLDSFNAESIAKLFISEVVVLNLSWLH